MVDEGTKSDWLDANKHGDRIDEHTRMANYASIDPDIYIWFKNLQIVYREIRPLKKEQAWRTKMDGLQDELWNMIGQEITKQTRNVLINKNTISSSLIKKIMFFENEIKDAQAELNLLFRPKFDAFKLESKS